jgi:hypothetical protein
MLGRLLSVRARKRSRALALRVHAPNGDLLAVLHTPEVEANLCSAAPSAIASS